MLSSEACGVCASVEHFVSVRRLLPCLCWCRRHQGSSAARRQSLHTDPPPVSALAQALHWLPLRLRASCWVTSWGCLHALDLQHRRNARQSVTVAGCSCWGARAANSCKLPALPAGRNTNISNGHLSLLLFALHSGHAPGRRTTTRHTGSKVLRRLLLCAVCVAGRRPQARHTHLRICLLAAGCWAAQSPVRTCAPRGPCTPTPPASACLPPTHTQTPPRPRVSQGAELTLGRCPGHKRHLHK